MRSVAVPDGAYLHTLSTKYMLKSGVPHKTIKTIMIANVMNALSSEMDILKHKLIVEQVTALKKQHRASVLCAIINLSMRACYISREAAMQAQQQ